MANAPFSAEQLAYLKANFAGIPHCHTWEEVKDPSDGQTVAAAFESVDAAIDALMPDDEEDEEEGGDI